jgi:phosphatidylinositol alpha-1,6-mannosyltransferase
MENLNWNIYTYLSSYAAVSVIGPYSGEIDNNPNIHRAPKKGFLFFLIYAFIQGFYLTCTKKPKIVFGGSLVVAPLLFFFKPFCPVAAYAHGLDIIYENKIYQKVMRFCLRFLDGIICNSRNTQNLILQNNHQIKNLTIISPCIEFDHYQNISLSNRLLGNRYILSVGRLTGRKGLIEFIENCFVDIAAQFPDLELVIAGGEPKEAVYHKVGYKKKLEKCITSNNLTGRVRLLGWVSEETKKQLFAHCECLVFPVIPRKNDVEGFGIVAIEAAACGKPTIGFDVDGVGDAIIDDITGKLIPLNNYLKVTETIRLIIDGTLHYQFNMDVVKKKYDCSQTSFQYLNFFEKLYSQDI